MPTLNFLLFAIVLNTALFAHQAQPEYVLVAIAIGLLVAAADGLFLYQITHSIALAKEQAQIAALEEGIGSYLEQSEPLQRQLESAARLRHDLRNHYMVVEQLCSRGDCEAAAAYLGELYPNRDGSSYNELHPAQNGN